GHAGHQYGALVHGSPSPADGKKLPPRTVTSSDSWPAIGLTRCGEEPEVLGEAALFTFIIRLAVGRRGAWGANRNHHAFAVERLGMEGSTDGVVAFRIGLEVGGAAAQIPRPLDYDIRRLYRSVVSDGPHRALESQHHFGCALTGGKRHQQS